MAMARQTLRAVDEADLVLLLVDGRAGLTAADEQIAQHLRTLGKPLLLVVNKTDGLDTDAACAEFHGLGLGEPRPIAASHGRGVRQLGETILAKLPEVPAEPEDAPPDEGGGIRVAVVGRPNVGKSTLINRILGEERLVAFDQPGTTRDSVAVPFERDGRNYTLVDTAGLRRRGKVFEAVEKFSVVKTLQAIERAHVVILVLDARQGVAEQDAALLGLVLDSGRAVVVAIKRRGAPGVRFPPRVSRFRRHPLHLRAAWQWRRQAVRLGRSRVRLGDARLQDLAVDRDSAARGAATPAATGAPPPHQAALRAPGRAQSPPDSDPRQPDRQRAAGLQALPRQHLPQGARHVGHAGAHRVPYR
jgi:small GTP-binding protein